MNAMTPFYSKCDALGNIIEVLNLRSHTKPTKSESAF